MQRAHVKKYRAQSFDFAFTLVCRNADVVGRARAPRRSHAARACRLRRPQTRSIAKARTVHMPIRSDEESILSIRSRRARAEYAERRRAAFKRK